jgi:chromosome segregation ATPase
MLRPPEAAAVTPLVDQVQADTTAARETAAKLENKVDDLHRATATLRAGITTATAESDRLRKQKAATEAELDGLWRMLTNEQAGAAALFREVESSKALAEQHRLQRMVAEKRIEELAKAAAAGDAERFALRQNHDAMASQIEAARKTEAELSAKLAKAEKGAAVASFIKGTVATVLIGLLVFKLISLASARLRP